MHRLRSDCGAAAVEFALVLPVLLIIVMGIIEFGIVLNAQVSVSAAAREGVRVMALQNNLDTAKETAISAAPSLNPELTVTQVTVSPNVCTPGSPVKVSIVYNAKAVTGYFGPSFDLTGVGVMRCGG